MGGNNSVKLFPNIVFKEQGEGRERSGCECGWECGTEQTWGTKP